MRLTLSYLLFIALRAPTIVSRVFLFLTAMVLEELSRAQERLQDIDAERSSLSTAIDLVCGHLRVSQSGEMSA